MYAELTWFQAFMYFSIQEVAQLCSPLEMEPPGFVIHFSKQFSWIFYSPHAWSVCWFNLVSLDGESNLDEDSSIGQVGFGDDLLKDSILNSLGVHD